MKIFRWILYLCAVTVLVFGAIFLSLGTIFGDIDWLFCESDFLAGIVIAPFFFFLNELLTIIVVERRKKTATARQMVNIYMGLKVERLLLSLTYIAVYYFVSGVQMKRFVLVFVVMYLIYLLFDTLYLASGEKKKKE